MLMLEVSQLTVTVDDHTYEMGRKEFNNFIKMLKKSLKKQPMILAIEKAGHVEMRKDVYKTQKDLTNAICKWNRSGYKVQYTRGV